MKWMFWPIFVFMEKQIKNFMWIVLTAGLLVSCVTTKVSSIDIMSIRKGMTMDEILQMYDKPDYRRFNEQGEEWEYHTANVWKGNKIILVQFENERVVGMDSFVAPVENPTNPVDVSSNNPDINSDYIAIFSSKCTGEELNQVYKDMKDRPFDEDKLKVLRLSVSKKLFTMKQVIKILSTLSFPSSQMTALKILAPRITNKGRVSMLLKKYPLLDDDKVYDLLSNSRR